MKKVAILSTFVFAFGVAMLVTAPTADAQPCVCQDADGQGAPDDNVCCPAADPEDPEGTVMNATGALGGGPDGTQVTCGSVFIDEETFVAGRIDPSAETPTEGCIAVGGENSNTATGEDPEACEEDAVAACQAGECAETELDSDACGGDGDDSSA